jgi:hypothetical protein
VRRRHRGKIFVRHPVNGKSKRGEEERSAANETAHKQNAEAENHSRNYKIEDGDVRWQFDPMPNVVPLVHFADQPHDRAKKESSAAVKSRRNRNYWNRRQPKRPPNWMKPSAEICECRRNETSDGDKKKFTRSHSNIAQLWSPPAVLARGNSKYQKRVPSDRKRCNAHARAAR